MASKRLTLIFIPMCICILFCNAGIAQGKPASADSVLNLPSTYFSRVQQRYEDVDNRITTKTEKYLKKLLCREKKTQRRLSKIDSTGAQQLFASSQREYTQLISKLKSSKNNVPGKNSTYIHMLDSVSTSLSFIGQSGSLMSGSKGVQEKVNRSLLIVTELQGKMERADQVKAFIQQRKQQIKESLSKYSNLPKGITNEFTGYQKQAYYFNAQLKEYKEMLNDPDKAIAKGLMLLNKLPAFAQFMRQHSQLAFLFRLPDNYGTQQSLAGLQTRSQIQQQIQTRLGGSGPNAQSYMQQNLNAAQNQLNQLKDRISKLGNSDGSDMDIPDFKPNSQKTKSFWRRLEYGTNFQTVKNNFFRQQAT